ncbi:uncharacterized protein LOC110463382 isoform X2 [Mizuhopecten yessoensis]|uniref:uncharacterized protein LOC110463382 isoform X1 n=1 Tax=Mizuhopecten yessoensis TaxID=6573 RepID=UPI000B45F0BD|nr:uncharacterized protein LOC110463382 isoform X1 [Mizuhopecten yessoensis]XP_021373594.1 uncharacterized protein LOC110463382 isoform X2 [Mizuhopecten yessoensis]
MLLIIVLYLGLPAEAVQSIDYPVEWKKCLREIRNEIPVDKEGGSLTVTTCLNQYLFSNGFKTWHSEPSSDYKTFSEEFCQVKPPDGEPIRKRKEYRMLSKDEKTRFHSALNKIWSNGTYDHIVRFHADSSAVPVAHGGPGFQPWHRIYLMRLEDELRKYEPDLTFPYWDCRVEAELYEEGLGPHWSKLWNNGYAGYGADIVTKGPFKDWQLRRRFGDGNLPNRKRVERLFNFTKEEVTSLPYGSTPFGLLERIHNSIHMWVGGDMVYISLAPKDPVFFLLHCFIDYLWESMRTYYKDKYGVNPAENFPNISTLSSSAQVYHNKSSPLPGFEPLTLLDGYSNQWTRDVYSYESSPMDKDCSECSDNDVRKNCIDICGRNLKCRNGKCVPKLLVPTFFDEFSTEHRPPTSRVRRDTTAEDHCHGGVCDFAEPSIQNDFMWNGDDDTNHFRWVPIKVLNRRPLHQKYNTYAVHDNHIDTSNDIFDPVLFPPLEQELPAGDPGTYDHCFVQSVQSYVVIRSDSLSAVSSPQIEKCPFSGKYAFDTEYAYLAVGNPQQGPVNVSFIAYDQCGRLCTPYCRQPDSQFKRCTGLFQLDGSYDGYGDNPSQVIAKQLYTTDGLHDLNDDNVFLVFDCDASMEYYFDRFL